MKKLELHEVWKQKMNGRTNKWLCGKTGINTSEISRILNGKLTPSKNQTDKINSVLNKSVII